MRRRMLRSCLTLAVALTLGAPANAADEQCQQIRSRYAAGRQHAVAENEMAFCAPREGRVDEAFQHLDQALTKGLHSFRRVSTDDDFRPLQADARWAPRMELLASAEARHLASINRELLELYETDQSDRRQQPIDWSGAALQVSASIGFALYPEDGDEPETLLRRADKAMYRAKTGGRGQVEPVARGERD